MMKRARFAFAAAFACALGGGAMAAEPKSAVNPSAPAAEAPRSITLKAVYDVSLLGIDVGSMWLEFTLKDGLYEARAYVQPEGIASLFTSNAVNAASTGRGELGVLDPAYSWVQQISPKRIQTVKMSFKDSTATSVSADPVYDPWEHDPTEAQKAGAIDPINAFVAMMMMRNAGSGEQACGTQIKVYDGRRRYNFNMWSGGYQNIRRGAGGYSGQVLYCVASYERIAGWEPHRIAEISDSKVDAYFAPIGRDARGAPILFLPVRLTGDAGVGEVVAVPREVTINGKPWDQYFAEGG